MTDSTEQFWAGEFGNSYTARNQIDPVARVPFFRKIIQLATPEDVLEVGCNRGHNLMAIKMADPTIGIAGCDINEGALDEAQKSLPLAELEICLAKEIESVFTIGGFGYDLVMTAGVLIHIPPEDLEGVMQSIIRTANDWILAIEYDYPTAEEVEYRGHDGKLWRRPYGKMYRDRGLKLIYTADVGPAEGFGDGCTAWLLQKVAS